MLPQGQDFTNWVDTLKTFNDVTIPALFGFIFFVLLLLGFYFLRGVFGRDKRRDVTNDKMLELIAGMQAGAKDRQAQIDRFAIQMEKSDDLSRAALNGVQAAMTSLAQSNENQTTSIRALIARTDHSVTLLQTMDGRLGKHDEFARVAVENLTRLVNEINSYICDTIPLLATKSEFDAAIGRLEDVQKITQDAIKECVEKKKYVTDENPIAIVPPIEPPPDIAPPEPKEGAA